MNTRGAIHELPELRNRTAVFRDRAHAGEVVSGMLELLRGADAVVFAVPAGGVPVAAVIAECLDCPLDVAVVSKITLPWNTEAGYGAVAFDGTVRLNRELIELLALGESVVRSGIAQTTEKVKRRVARLRGERPLPVLAGRLAIVVDDGLASGFTMLTAAEALRRQGAERLIVAVPTGHAEALENVTAETDAIYCANVREGRRFAVADAYARWSDVDETTAARIIQRFQHDEGHGPKH